MATLEQAAGEPDANDGVRRRDFINIAAVSFAGVGAAAAVGPLVTQMSPSADVLALASVEVDISKIAAGQAIKTMWRKQPVFIRNLTPEEIAEANAVDVSTLRDPQSLADRTKPGKEVHIGTRLEIHKGSYAWDITVAQIPKQRRPASEAIHFYEETEESRTKRERLVAEQRLIRAAAPTPPSTKPSKKDRRMIHRFTGKE